MDFNWQTEMTAILPELLLTGYSFLLLIVSLMLPRGQRHLAGYLSLLCVVITLLLVIRAWTSLPPAGVKVFWGMFVLDPFSLFFKAIFLIGAALAIMLSLRFLEVEREQSGEYYALMLMATVGMMFMASSRDLVMVFVSLETMSLASYLLVAYLQGDPRSNEAGLKYFILGAFSSGIFVYGISLVYGATGSTDLLQIAVTSQQPATQSLLLMGMILMIVSLGFKVAAAPFHMWVPDAYEGAPSPVTAFISTASKAAAFAIFVRIFAEAFPAVGEQWTVLIAALSLVSMTVGNVAAIRQENMKRMLAYSSIAHAGYILMGLLAIAQGGEIGAFGLSSVLIYLLVYTFMNMGAFGFVVMLRREGVVGDRISDFAGMAYRAPVAGFAMLLLMLSLAGIPATAGFIGKWHLFGAAIRADYAWLAVAAVINSAISLYYYIRVVVYMYMRPPEEPAEDYAPSGLLLGALVISLVFTVILGIYPQPLIEFAQAALMR